MNKLISKISLFFIGLFGIFSALPVMAQSIGFDPGKEGGPSTLDIIANTANYSTNIKDANLIDTTIGQLIAIFLGLLGLLFLALIIYSGFQWMSAGGNEETVATAKKRIINAALGFALIFFSYIITNFVFNFLNQQSGGRTTPPEVQACQTDSDCPNNMICLQNGKCQPRQNPGNIRCVTNDDCPALQPLCQSFLGLNIKWCTCDAIRGPACPNNYTCQEDIFSSNQCEPTNK